MTCPHLHVDDPTTDPAPLADEGCQECLVIGHSDWVHLRLCLTCGHVGCCNASEGKHAFHHFEDTGHPIVRSHEPGETWSWCWIDEVEL